MPAHLPPATVYLWFCREPFFSQHTCLRRLCISGFAENLFFWRYVLPARLLCEQQMGSCQAGTIWCRKDSIQSSFKADSWAPDNPSPEFHHTHCGLCLASNRMKGRLVIARGKDCSKRHNSPSLCNTLVMRVLFEFLAALTKHLRETTQGQRDLFGS